ncbi:MAG: 30S ribosomal protein S8 [Chloroflexota bacterium]
MTISDPIADMLTRIRNAIMTEHTMVAMPGSKIKEAIARVLLEEGFIESYEVVEGKHPDHKVLRLRLKYVGQRRQRQCVITGLERISRPGLRVYANRQQIPWVLSGMGVAILSTPKGVMTGQQARKLGIGGEILCKVW